MSRGGRSSTYYRYVRDRGQDAVKRSKLVSTLGQAVKGVDRSYNGSRSRDLASSRLQTQHCFIPDIRRFLQRNMRNITILL